MDLKKTLQDGISEIVAFLPNLIAFLVILLIGFIVAKVVSGIVRKLLEKTGVDDHMRRSDAGQRIERVMPGASVAKGVGAVVFWLIFIFFFFSAIGALKIPALTDFMTEVLSYLPNVIVAIAIFVIAALVSGAVAGGVAKVMGDTPTGKIVAAVVPAVVMVIALFMILEQLQIAPEIVRIAFAAVMGALALGLALAFGLGGRGVAERLLEDAYRNSQEAKRRAKEDLQVGRERAESQVGGSGTSGASSDYAGPSTGSTGTTSTTGDTTPTTSFTTRTLGDDPR